MPETPHRHIHTIPAWRPFLDDLARQLIAETRNAPETLTDYLILLPTRRAARSLAEAFLRVNEGAAMLLPRIAPVGDLDSADLPSPQFLTDEAARAGISPAISPLRRRLILARLIRARGDLSLSLGQSLRLADSLAILMDHIEVEGCDIADLQHLVPHKSDYAEHWQMTLDFLTLVTEAWPQILAEEGMVDGVTRRNRLLRAQAEAWQAQPPQHPVLIAGVTGSIPAVAELMQSVAQLPQGRVILPGLDQNLTQESFGKLTESHPQYAMKRCLAGMGLLPQDIPLWPGLPPPDEQATARAKLITEMMRPAEETGLWQDMPALPEAALRNLYRINAPDAETEARVIALILRQALDKPERTAALITPDRDLATRVSAQMGRWGVELDDSAGFRLDHTSAGQFLLRLAQAVDEGLAPVALLSLLKHPLYQYDDKRHEAIRRIETHLLRGSKPGAGFMGLQARLGLCDPQKTRGYAQMQGWLKEMQAHFAPFMEALAAEAMTPAEIMRRHITLAEKLARSATESGAARLWQGHEGEALARFLREALTQLEQHPAIAGRAYTELFATLLEAETAYSPYGSHPRLHLLGPMEARLQRYDLVVLGGLNEGIWPREAAGDPWMSREMRRDFGLPAPEQAQGLAAHDFTQALAADQVFLTRAERSNGQPQLPSRWLERLDAVLQACGHQPEDVQDPIWLHYAEALDAVEISRAVMRPRPTPPLAARPQRFSVTDIETLRRDPYAFYAKRILGLYKMEELEEEPGVAERGSFIHAALEAFIRAHPETLPEDAYDRLISAGQTAFGDALARPEVKAFWWPRYERIARWVLEQEQSRRPQARPVVLEEKAEHSFTLADGTAAQLVAKADRIDHLRDEGGYEIIDYKTGSAPSGKEITYGYSPQLLLEALLLKKGAFPKIAKGAEATQLTYWKLSGLLTPGEITNVKVREELARIEADLLQLLNAYRDAEQPYPAAPVPQFTLRYNDYAHLARLAEWSLSGENGEE